MSDRPTCVDCSALAPETNTSHTLISASFGWRLTRRQKKDGTYAAEWRCASCWRKHKGSPVAAPPGGGAPAQAPARVGSSTMRWFKRGS